LEQDNILKRRTFNNRNANNAWLFYRNFLILSNRPGELNATLPLFANAH